MNANISGGICLNWGCIPTKALLRAAELRHSIGEMESFGISVGTVSVDLAKVVAAFAQGGGTPVYGCQASFEEEQSDGARGKCKNRGKAGVLRQVNLSDGSSVLARHIIVATGARARSLPGIVPDGKTILTYREAMVPETMPESLIIIGSGAIGSEFASFIMIWVSR